MTGVSSRKRPLSPGLDVPLPLPHHSWGRVRHPAPPRKGDIKQDLADSRQMHSLCGSGTWVYKLPGHSQADAVPPH